MGRRQVAVIAGIAGGAAAAYAAYRWRKAKQAEIDMLAGILGWLPGRSVADVGAGSGGMAIAAARRIGPTGRVFASDVEPAKVEKTRKKATRAGLPNVTPVHATQFSAGLRPECCDAILLRGSYHHFTDPAATNATLHRALRPGGVLAVIDFPPKRLLSIFVPVKGVPENRGGHGIPRQVLIDELTAAGFKVERIVPRWLFDGLYCVVFRKE